MDDRSSEIVWHNFHPLMSFVVGKLIRWVTSPRDSNTAALPETRKCRAPETALLFPRFSLRLDASTPDCVRGEFHIEPESNAGGPEGNRVAAPDKPDFKCGQRNHERGNATCSRCPPIQTLRDLRQKRPDQLSCCQPG
jgi:hypothetical protein